MSSCCWEGEACVSPLVFVQLGHTRGRTLVCGDCGSFAAGARGQLVAKELLMTRFRSFPAHPRLRK